MRKYEWWGKIYVNTLHICDICGKAYQPQTEYEDRLCNKCGKFACMDCMTWFKYDFDRWGSEGSWLCSECIKNADPGMQKFIYNHFMYNQLEEEMDRLQDEMQNWAIENTLNRGEIENAISAERKQHHKEFDAFFEKRDYTQCAKDDEESNTSS